MSGPVILRKVEDRIHAEIAYNNGAGPLEAKAVPGARWNPSERAWTYPLAIDVCRELRRQFGARLRIDNSLADWARQAIEAEAEQIKLRSAADASLNRVAD